MKSMGTQHTRAEQNIKNKPLCAGELVAKSSNSGHENLIHFLRRNHSRAEENIPNLLFLKPHSYCCLCFAMIRVSRHA